MTEPAERIWVHRVAGLVLLILYLPTYVILLAGARNVMRTLSGRGEWWEYALAVYTIFSCVLVGMSLVALIFCGRLVEARQRTALALLLALNWLPQVIVVGLWSMLHDPYAWIE